LYSISSGIRFGDHYRNVPEERILDAVHLSGWVYENKKTHAREHSRQAINHCIEMGLGVRHTQGTRLFDPVEVLNFIKWMDLKGHDTFWADQYVATGRRLVEDLASLDDGKAFKIDLRRTFHIHKAVRRTRLRMPLPLASDHLTEIEVSPFADIAECIQFGISPGRLEALLVTRDAGDLTIGATLSFNASRQHVSPGGTLCAEETELYLRPQEGLIVVSERVHALAHSLMPAKQEALKTVRVFWNYILNELICGAIHYDQVRFDAPCDWVLEAGWFDCQLGAALLATLCRASGIPARLVGGHLLYKLAPTIHYWAEVWLDGQGWMPVDFLGWDLSRGGRDAGWRDRFFGSLDHRMTTQVMPLTFTGAIGLAVPKDFIVLQTARNTGVEIALLGADGTPCYTDYITVEE
jgi:hypothetical protein